MDARNEDSVEKLFEKFGDAEHAREYAGDIRKGERIFAEHAVPQLGQELRARIKVQVNDTLKSQNRTGLRPIVYRAAAVLVIIGVLSIGILLWSRDDTLPAASLAVVPSAVWDSENIVDDDADLATLSGEVRQLEGELMALQLGENTGSSFGELDELEVELIDIDSDFWKG